MQLIKLDATDSTNAYLRRISAAEDLADFTVVQAALQTAGRGQPGTHWASEEGKNLTFSVLKKFKSFPARAHFMLNARISLSVHEALSTLEIPDLHLKWPNDIMSGSRKICGILVENQIQGDTIARSIIGIGLNVNQIRFPNLPSAASLRKVTGRVYNLDEVLASLLGSLEAGLASLDPASFGDLLKGYNARLYLRDTREVFYRMDGTPFTGAIRGVGQEGMLRIELEDGTEESFGFKEVRYPGIRGN
jgi:BirA family biotin operon repressor/biotin-[acetyl-CoA-carboxylase] ligase